MPWRCEPATYKNNCGPRRELPVFSIRGVVPASARDRTTPSIILPGNRRAQRDPRGGQPSLACLSAPRRALCNPGRTRKTLRFARATVSTRNCCEPRLFIGRISKVGSLTGGKRKTRGEDEECPRFVRGRIRNCRTPRMHRVLCSPRAADSSLIDFYRSVMLEFNINIGPLAAGLVSRRDEARARMIEIDGRARLERS